MKDEIVVDGVTYVRKKSVFDPVNVWTDYQENEVTYSYRGKHLVTIGIDKLNNNVPTITIISCNSKPGSDAWSYVIDSEVYE